MEIPLECPKYLHPISDWAVYDFRWSKSFLYLSNFSQLLNYKLFVLWSYNPHFKPSNFRSFLSAG